MKDQPEENKLQKREKEGVKPYLKYSGMAFQMIGVLVVAAFAGMKLDEYYETENPWFTIVFMLIAVVTTMVMTIVSLNKKE